jgi:hypothetical protein
LNEEDKGSCYWDQNRMRLVGRVKSKVCEMLRDKLIIEKEEGVFHILPLKGCRQENIVDLNKGLCNCQQYNDYLSGRSDKVCSHWHAVQVYVDRKNSPSVE